MLVLTAEEGEGHRSVGAALAAELAGEAVEVEVRDAFQEGFSRIVAFFSRDLYRAHGPLAWAMRAGQVVALAAFVWAVASVGVQHLTGYGNVRAWAAGAEVPPMPDGQEPASQRRRRSSNARTCPSVSRATDSRFWTSTCVFRSSPCRSSNASSIYSVS